MVNLVGLLAIGAVAERVLGRLQWGVVAVISVSAAPAFALWRQSAGAGNSILNCGVTGALTAFAFSLSGRGHDADGSIA